MNTLRLIVLGACMLLGAGSSGERMQRENAVPVQLTGIRVNGTVLNYVDRGHGEPRTVDPRHTRRLPDMGGSG